MPVLVQEVANMFFFDFILNKEKQQKSNFREVVKTFCVTIDKH